MTGAHKTNLSMWGVSAWVKNNFKKIIYPKQRPTSRKNGTFRTPHHPKW
jgi:hypothetical protein